MFKNDRERVEDEECFDEEDQFTLIEQHIQKIKKLLLDNNRLTIKDIGVLVGILFGSYQSILRNNFDLHLASFQKDIACS